MPDYYSTSTLWPLLPQEAVSPTAKKLLQALGWRFEQDKITDGRPAWYCYSSEQDGPETPDAWTDVDREALAQEPLRSYLPNDEESLETIDDIMRTADAVTYEDLKGLVGDGANLFAAILHDPACKDIPDLEIQGACFSSKAVPNSFGGWADLIRRDGIHSISTSQFLNTKRHELQDHDKVAQEINEDEGPRP